MTSLMLKHTLTPIQTLYVQTDFCINALKVNFCDKD